MSNTTKDKVAEVINYFDTYEQPDIVEDSSQRPVPKPRQNVSRETEVASTQQIKYSLARLCQKSEESVKYEPIFEKNIMYLNIPCPKCKTADCFWHCEKCSERLRYDQTFIFCSCSYADLLEYEFRCINKHHGNEYCQFKANEVEKVLKKLTDMRVINILLLGLTGSGKTIFINSIANYLTYESLEEAKHAPLVYLVPSSFQITDKNFETTIVQVGKESETESFSISESATRSPRIHTIIYNNMAINLIDTPGLGDTRGGSADKENIDLMLGYICGFKELHGICVMFKSNEGRKLIVLQYCINQLLMHFHRNSIQNFVFCFTHTRGSMPQDSVSTLNELLKYINTNNGTNIRLNSNIAYSTDNEAFRYLCAHKLGIYYGDKSDIKYCFEAWKKSRDATFALLNHILSVPPHHTNETLALNKIRSTIIALSKPLAIITKDIQKNQSSLESQIGEIEQLRGREDDFLSKLKITRIRTKKHQLNHWRVVCSKCAILKWDDKQNKYVAVGEICCEGCKAPILPFCAELLNIQGKCRKCKCSRAYHEHINYEYKEIYEEVVDERAVEDLKSLKTDIERKEKAKEIIETIIKELQDEQVMVNKYAAQFASYLNSSVIVFTNQSHEDYLNMMIEQEKVLASKNGNYELVERLKDALKEYKEQKEFLENQIMASNNASQIQFSVEDVNRALADLCAMKHSGSTIKDILDKDIANPMTRHANLIRQQYEPNQPKGEIKKGHVQRMIEFFMQYWN